MIAGKVVETNTPGIVSGFRIQIEGRRERRTGFEVEEEEFVEAC